ncbi:MAG: acyltransferase family protein [Muribaculaceae bacterium]|nr:acyltransferase family protein [Muribaculaceae bacterium]
MNIETAGSKPRYEILDGLRGVAAVIVVMFHLLETYSRGVPYQILNHGYLAVDFFFVLSGFVVGYAYDSRWSNGLTFGNFCKRRIIRLQPMLVFGTLVGALLFFMQGDHPDFSMIKETPWWIVILLMVWGGTVLPIPKAWDIRGWSEFNPLNGATWSLLWEYLANLLYGLFLHRLRMRTLVVLSAIAALLVVNVCLNIDIFGVLAVRDYAAYTMIGGWSLSPDQLLIGFSRLAYPFLIGLVISRVARMKIHVARHGFIWCTILLAMILVAPRVGGAEPSNYWMNGTYEIIAILLLFPLIIMMGRGSTVAGEKYESLCRFLGDISYPLYVTHYPIIYVQMSWAASHKDAPASQHIFMGCCFFVIAIGLAYASMKLYDMPVREWLTNKFMRKKMRIEHCAIWVRDIERTREFFEAYFMAEAGARYDNAKGFSSYFLSLPDGGCRVEIMTHKGLSREDVTDGPKTGCGHIAISVGSEKGVDELTGRLTMAGYSLVSGPRVTGDGYYESCFCIDNDFMLELTV